MSLYTAAKTSPAGDQLKAYNGIYLTRWKLNQVPEASTAFGDAVAYGLRRNRLAVKFLFQPGSTQFYQDPQVSGQYPIWLEQIAQQTAQQTAKANGCIEVTGHTSRTGSQQINEQLSLQRANYVKGQLERDAPHLNGPFDRQRRRVEPDDGRHRQGRSQRRARPPRRVQADAEVRLIGRLARDLLRPVPRFGFHRPQVPA